MDIEGLNSMLRRLADYAEQGEQIAIAERDQAIREKGQISRRREAVSMNATSQLSKKVARLEDRLGEGKNWSNADFIPWLKEFYRGKDMNVVKQVVGIRLTDWCNEHNYRIKKVTDERYGQVNAYPAMAIKKYHQFLTSSHVEKAQYEWLLRAHNHVL